MTFHGQKAPEIYVVTRVRTAHPYSLPHSTQQCFALSEKSDHIKITIGAFQVYAKAFSS
jgi:hypothetical protein